MKSLVARLGWLPWIAAGAAAWILLLASRTPVPSEDGVSYLWMAQQFAAGEWRAALSLVFPPGFPLLCAPGIALGFDPEATAIGLGALSVAAMLVPLARLAEHFAVGAGLLCAILGASSPLLSRLAAECYSEPPFLLLMAWGTWWGVRGRWWHLGLCAGLGFWIRPEGLLLVAAFGVLQPRVAWRAAVPAVLAVLGLAALRQAVGHGFDPLPILGFHELRDDLPQRGAVFSNLLEVPGGWLEAFGIAGLLPLALLWPRRSPLARGQAPLVIGILLQIAVVCTFVVRRRFFVSAAVPVFVLGAVVLAALPRRARDAWLVLAASLGLGASLFGTIDPDRHAERELGLYLRAQLQPGRTVTGDLPRVLWFAGQTPLPPRHFDAGQLAVLATPEVVQFVVLSERSRRASSTQVRLPRAAEFERLQLPEPLAGLCHQRGLAVFARK